MAIKVETPELEPGYAQIYLGGPLNSGKTFTGLGFSNWLAVDQPFLVIDFETLDGGVNARSKIYGQTFPLFRDLIHIKAETPKGILDTFKEALEYAHKAKPPVLMIDGLAELWNASEAWTTEIAKKAAKDGKEPNRFAAYRTTKPELKALIRLMLSFPGHLVATCLLTPKGSMEDVEKVENGRKVTKREVVTRDTWLMGESVEKRFNVIFVMSEEEAPDPARPGKTKSVRVLRPASNNKIAFFREMPPQIDPQGRVAGTIYKYFRQEDHPRLSGAPKPVETTEPAPPAPNPEPSQIELPSRPDVVAEPVEDEHGEPLGRAEAMTEEEIEEMIVAALGESAIYKVEEVLKRRDWFGHWPEWADKTTFRRVYAAYLEANPPYDGNDEEGLDAELRNWYAERGWGTFIPERETGKAFTPSSLWMYHREYWNLRFETKAAFNAGVDQAMTSSFLDPTMDDGQAAVGLAKWLKNRAENDVAF